jgi:CRISPR/Cas system endoribonuclease Cas6 (RAMP superfamily)
MTEDQNERAPKRNHNINIATGSAGGFYFIGFIGAAVYFVSTAVDFWDGALGLLQAALWPGFLVYEALSMLGA